MLRSPYTSSPTSPPKYVVYYRCEGRLYTSGYRELYAAKHELLHLKAEQLTLTTASAPHGVMITSAQLSDIMEHQLTAEEAAWQLPPSTIYQLDKLINGSAYAAYGAAHKEKQRTEAPAKRTPSPRSTPDGLVTLADICAAINLSPKEARSILRSKSFPKPSHGQWSFPPSDVDAVKKVLTS